MSWWMNREELLRNFGSWYPGMKWDWFGTLTFERKDIPLSVARRAFDMWMDEVLGDDRDLTFCWLRVSEYKITGGILNFHVFFHSSRKTSKYVWMAHWKEVVKGEADIVYSSTSKGAKEYLENAVHPESDFQIEHDDQNFLALGHRL